LLLFQNSLSISRVHAVFMAFVQARTMPWNPHS
jgi:hypothetical protein